MDDLPSFLKYHNIGPIRFKLNRKKSKNLIIFVIYYRH